jgi:translocation and assembly module TamB
MGDVMLHLAGTLESSGQAVAVSEIRVRYPEASWTLQHPARVVFGGGQLSTSELTLESGRQRIWVDGGVFGRRLEVAARIENVTLERLPRVLLPRNLELAGELNARIRAAGATARPEATITLSLRDGRIEELTGVELDVDGQYVRDRAMGEIVARAMGSEVKGNFDLPVRGLLAGTRDPISAALTAQQLQIEPLLQAFGVDPGVSGTAAATLTLQGTGMDPGVRLVVAGKEVRHRSGPAGDLDALVESGADGKLHARIDLRAMGAQGSLSANTPWAAADLLRGRMSGRALWETPL